MKRWHDSIITTITVTVVTALVLGFSLENLVKTSLPYFGIPAHQRIPGSVTRIYQQLPGRIAVLLDILDATPAAGRAAIIAAAQRPQIHVRLLTGPIPSPVDTPEADATLLRRRIEGLLTKPRPVIVVDQYDTAGGTGVSKYTRFEKGVVIETALFDGQWLLFSLSFDPPPATDPVAARYLVESFAIWLTLAALSGLMLSVLAARRLVKPLSDLCRAVEHLGGSGDDQPMIPRGPREIKATILAFNQMLERLRRFNEDRTRMIAAMSHDLRSPLTRLRLRTELGPSSDQQAKALAEVDLMEKIIESILTFARDDAKREPRSLVDLSALVEGICEDAADAGEPVTYSGSRGVTLFCRSTALRRAIANLVDNAVKYGGNTVVSLVTEENQVLITVDDEGPGIPTNEREKVFDPFYRIDASRNSETGGVGLGLSVARSVVWEHGGNITLADRPGGGLSVRLVLPSAAESSQSNVIDMSSEV